MIQFIPAGIVSSIGPNLRRSGAISGYDIHFSAKNGQGGYSWFVDSEIDGRSTRADLEVMVWSALVRVSMQSGILATYVQMWRTAHIYIASGALCRRRRFAAGIFGRGVTESIAMYIQKGLCPLW